MQTFFSENHLLVFQKGKIDSIQLKTVSLELTQTYFFVKSHLQTRIAGIQYSQVSGSLSKLLDLICFVVSNLVIFLSEKFHILVCWDDHLCSVKQYVCFPLQRIVRLYDVFEIGQHS